MNKDFKTLNNITKSGALSKFLIPLYNFFKFGNVSITGFRFDRENNIIYITRNGIEEDWDAESLFNPNDLER